MFLIRIRRDPLLNTGTPLLDPDPVPVAIKLLKCIQLLRLTFYKFFFYFGGKVLTRICKETKPVLISRKYVGSSILVHCSFS
jgi:hypothetical protein